MVSELVGSRAGFVYARASEKQCGSLVSITTVTIDHDASQTGSAVTKLNEMRPHHSLKLLCWNICSHSRDKLGDPKVEIPEVSRLLNNHDIFAMQETKGDINLQNYCCFNSNSGGVCIGVHKSLKHGVTRATRLTALK